MWSSEDLGRQYLCLKNGQGSSARSLLLEFASMYSVVELCLSLVVVAMIIFCVEPKLKSPLALLFVHSMG